MKKMRVIEFEEWAKVNLAEDAEAVLGEEVYYNSPVLGPIRTYRNRVYRGTRSNPELICELEED
jgi:hypothetical protein